VAEHSKTFLPGYLPGPGSKDAIPW
jgi:hypothetical protein